MKLLKAILPALTVVLTVALGLIVWQNYKLAHPAEEPPDTTYIPGDVSFVEDDVIQVVPDFAEGANITDIRLAFAGDLVCHSGLNTEAYNAETGAYDYSGVLGGSLSYIADADFSACTLETTLADAAQYSGYPLCISPKSLASTLSSVGFDLINTATNHCMDGGQEGIGVTLDTLDSYGLKHVGTYRSQQEKDASQGVYMAEVSGIKVAYIAYTYGLEDEFSVSGFDYAVNILFKDYLDESQELDYEGIKANVDYAKSQGADVIVAMLHWGNEYYTSPVDYQTQLTDTLFAEGVDIIMGGHAYVPQPVEMRVVTDNEGNLKNCFVCYCAGNYCSCFSDKNTNLSAVFYLDVTKDWDSGKTYLTDVSYVPTFMVDLEEYDVFDAGWRYKLWDLHGAISSYEAGNDLGVINEKLYTAMKDGLEELHSIFGAEHDYYNTQADAGASE